jgi:hypothetical protein
MALVIGNQTYSAATPSAITRTISHTQDSGADGYLFVFICCPTTTVTGVTYNSVAMTLHERQNVSAYSSDWTLWKLAAPSTGANNVVVTFAAAQYNSTSFVIVSATGCNSIGQTSYESSGSTSVERTITSLETTSKLFIGGMAGNNSGNVLSGISSPATNAETNLYNHNVNNYTFGAFATITLATTSYAKVTASTTVTIFAWEVKEAASAVTRKRIHVT